MNPPYKKIRSDSGHRAALRRAGIETVNLYPAFVALSLSLLGAQGQLVAIIPRSFCNGPYYRLFREFILERAAIQHIHLFSSRNQAFKDDKVLQENIIIRLDRGVQQGPVVVSTSMGDDFTNRSVHEYAFDCIVLPNDPQQFIHIPLSSSLDSDELYLTLDNSLVDLGIRVSTGPVVDFRMREYLRQIPEAGTVPLLYPNHFSSRGTEWPQLNMKKPNAILYNSFTEKWLYANGCYCVVRRLSSKEEQRRIVASVVEPTAFGDAVMLGFENHLNVFHDNRRGLPQVLAVGLAAFLNTTAVDQYFRRFNGHTQVNVTDLKQIRYPSRDVLVALGKWVQTHNTPSQRMIDDKLSNLIR